MDYGVKLGSPGVLKTVNELPTSDIETVCGTNQMGCVKDGHVYYREGDECALRHELCHVMNGPFHTVKYHQQLIAGKATCPGGL